MFSTTLYKFSYLRTLRFSCFYITPGSTYYSYTLDYANTERDASQKQSSQFNGYDDGYNWTCRRSYTIDSEKEKVNFDFCIYMYLQIRSHYIQQNTPSKYFTACIQRASPTGSSYRQFPSTKGYSAQEEGIQNRVN